MDVTTRVAVVGLGLIGGSVVRRLRAAGVAVVGLDASEGTRRAAEREGVMVVPDMEALCATDPELVVLAVPLRAMRVVASDLARHLAGRGTSPVVTDVGSVKGPVRDALRAAGLGASYVGAHPMAGTERSGFEASDAALLTGAHWAVTIDDETDAGHVLRVVALVTGPLGGVVHVLTDEVHDEATALVSHVPHVLATVLLNLVADAPVREIALALAAGSFRDGTRVARTDPRRTEAMVTENAGWVAPALRVVIRDLYRLVERLETNASVAEFFDRADAVRPTGERGVAQLPGAHMSATGAPAERACVEVRLDAHGDWRAALVGLGAEGRAVVGVDLDRAVLLAD